MRAPQTQWNQIVNSNTTPRGAAAAIREDNRQLQALGALERIEWAHRHYRGSLVLNSSFGPQSIVCLSLALEIDPRIAIVMIELPGPEYEMQRLYRDYLKSILGLNLHIVQAAGEDQKKTALCEFLNAHGARASIAGVRRQQTRTRSTKDLLEIDRDYPAIFKLHPIADWSDARTWEYIERLPEAWRHPVYRRGLRSIGGALLDSGAEKTECGLHL
jgi:3'-phosphoadenosine 5'-phosphosulfate sulfotransferase (PAPS reductase)/FAD synthetase